jgi:hypothetical protein
VRTTFRADKAVKVRKEPGGYCMAGTQVLRGFASSSFKESNKQNFACSLAAKMNVAAASVRIVGVKDTIRATQKQCWHCGVCKSHYETSNLEFTTTKRPSPSSLSGDPNTADVFHARSNDLCPSCINNTRAGSGLFLNQRPRCVGTIYPESSIEVAYEVWLGGRAGRSRNGRSTESNRRAEPFLSRLRCDKGM